MSVYATVAGELKFSSKKNYNKAVAILKDGGWVSNKKWIDESGSAHNSFEEEPLQIEIPMFYYRNLLHALDEIVPLSSYHDIVWASTDGSFSGGLISSGGNRRVDLEEWAINNGMDKPDNMEDEDGNLSDAGFQWRDEVVEDFVKNPGNL